MEVVYLILARPELLQHADVFTGSPNGVDRYVEFELAADEQGEFGEGQLIGRESGLDCTGTTLTDRLLDGFRD